MKTTFITLLMLFFAVASFAQNKQAADSLKQDTVEWKVDAADTAVYTAVQVSARFPGGKPAMERFIAEHLQRPTGADVPLLKGNVYVSFIVEKDGSINRVTILRGLNKAYNQQAINVIKQMPKWQAAHHRGYLMRELKIVAVEFAP